MNPETTQRDLLEIIQRLERLETSGNVSKRTASGIRVQKEILERILMELSDMERIVMEKDHKAALWKKAYHTLREAILYHWRIMDPAYDLLSDETLINDLVTRHHNKIPMLQALSIEQLIIDKETGKKTVYIPGKGFPKLEDGRLIYE